MFADSVTGGFIGGSIVAGVFALVFGLWLLASVIWPFKDYDKGLWIGSIIIASVCLLITVVAYVWASWPFSYEYHHWIDKNVVATSTPQSRFLSDGDGNISQKFVIRDTRGVYYGINDTRASLIKEGQTLHLKCKKAYDFGVPRAAHGWDCKWAEVMPNG